MMAINPQIIAEAKSFIDRARESGDPERLEMAKNMAYEHVQKWTQIESQPALTQSRAAAPEFDWPRLALSGATLGHGEEAVAGTTAVLTAPFSDKPFLEAVPEIYRDIKSEEGPLLEQARERRGLAGLLTEIGGGGLLGAFGAARAAAPTVAQRIGKATGIGALFGLGEASGEAETLADIPTEAAIRVPMGAATAGLAEPVTSLAGALLGRWRRGAGQADEERAEDLLASAQQRSGQTPEQIAQQMEAMPGSVLADVPGFEGRALAVRSAGGRGGDIGEEVIGRRMEEIPTRATEAVQRLGTGPAYRETRAAMAEQIDAEISPAYNVLRNTSPMIPISDPNVQQFLTRPAVAKAYRDVQESMRNSPMDFPAPPEGAIDFNVMHRIRRRLDSDANVAERAGDTAKARDLQNLRNEFDGYMKDTFPGLREADAEFSTTKDLMKAGDIGEQVFGTNRRRVRDELAKLKTPEEREMFQAGAIQKLQLDIADKSNPLGILRNRLGSIREALGDEAADEIDTFLKREARFGRTAQRTAAKDRQAEVQQALEEVGLGRQGPIGLQMGLRDRLFNLLEKQITKIRSDAAQRRSDRVMGSLGETVFETRPDIVRARLEDIARRRPDIARAYGAALGLPIAQQVVPPAPPSQGQQGTQGQ